LNGTKSRITDLESDETKPEGWDHVTSPPLRSFSDMSLYELHVRDFSVNDLTVSPAHRGMYEAFNDQNSDGMTHLRALAANGLKAVHILPSFHFASVNEDKFPPAWRNIRPMVSSSRQPSLQARPAPLITGAMIPCTT
jgi:pullulanase